MEKKLILPGAAGVIALTALFGFMDGCIQNKIKDISRKSIYLVSNLTGTDHRIDSVLQRHKVNSTRPAYMVQIELGEKLSKVLINAKTGEVIECI
jgi:hypothetical protein